MILLIDTNRQHEAFNTWLTYSKRQFKRWVAT